MSWLWPSLKNGQKVPRRVHDNTCTASRTPLLPFLRRVRHSVMPCAYYNEIDPKAAAWLRELIRAGVIAPGEVDERSIVDIRPADLAGFSQCHFFAGVGVWSYALRLAGWPDSRPGWTGSCPCQPYSEAGKGLGFADERHLWPAWFHLIEQREPCVVFGEQVASAGARVWLDLVQTDLEACGYAFGPIVVPAAGIGAPHGRHRTWFVADAPDRGHRGQREPVRGGELGDAKREGLEGHGGHGDDGDEPGRIGAPACGSIAQAGPTNGFWRECDWLPCTDGKARPVEPGTFPLAHGAAERVGRLRGYGNAIVAELAAEVVKAYLAWQR